MTFNNAAWAIDGPITDAALARTAVYASSDREGIIQRSDLVVSALSTPGNGVQISPGAALVLNRYKGGVGVSDEMYTVVNPTTHIISSADMPATTVGSQNYIVCVSVGDPEFDQTGHPWMLSSDPPVGTESTFNYVRPIVVLESVFNARTWPAVGLARITRPGSTTTITSGMIDASYRELARPRQLPVLASVPVTGSPNPLNAVTPSYERWPNLSVATVAIPPWASRAKIMGFIEGARFTKTGAGRIWAYVEGTSIAGTQTNIDDNMSGTGDQRRTYNFSADLDVSSVAGTTKSFAVRGNVDSGGLSGFLTTNAKTSVSMLIIFEEKPV